MNQLDVLGQLSVPELALIVFTSVCISIPLTALICAPRRNCFFFRWSPAARFLVLLAAPILLIIWPILLYNWFLRSRGIDPADPDFWDG